MSINIHGKEYITVAERVKAVHEALPDKNFEISTEVLSNDPVVIKATVKIGTGIFTGISAANPDKAIEKMSPYEVAETSAIGRALGFAGFGVVDDIATADEMVKSGAFDPRAKSTPDEMDINFDDLEPTVKKDGVSYCKICGKHTSEKVTEFSTKKYGYPLCMDCQKKQSRADDAYESELKNED